jgi:hypothetical protein
VLTRRNVLRLAGAGGAAALLAGCGDGEEPASREELARRDLRLVGRGLDLENTVIAAYAAGEGLLSDSALGSSRAIVSQEREHAARLERLVRDLGGRPTPPKTDDEYARSFPRLRGQRDALRFAVDVENMAVRFYIEALPKLSDPELRRLAASILTSEAEHAALLRAELGRQPVPDAFVTGRSRTR